MIDEIRAYPHAVGAEKSVLSSMLQEPAEYIPEAIDAGLKPEMFFMPSNRILCEEIYRLATEGKPIELVSMVQGMLDKNRLDAAGGPSSITDVYSYAPSGQNFRQHCAIVLDKHFLRETINVANEILKSSWEQFDNGRDAIDEADRLITGLRNKMDRRTGQSKKEAINEVFAEMQMLMHGRIDEIGIMSGFKNIDRLTRGFRPGQMIVIAARPSMGKTAIMMNIVEHIAIELKIPVQIYSMEMPKKDLYARTIYGRAAFNPSSISEGQSICKGELIRIQRSTQEVTEAPIEIDDTPALTITELRSKARRAVSKGARLIAIDYLQLMRSTSKQADFSREREISEISAGCKAMAKELSVPVIVLAQLNRDSEKRTGSSKGVPRMADLRDSGSIEQDADMIGLLHREEYFAATPEEKESFAGQARIIWAKNRNGATGDAHMKFIKELTRFTDSEPPAQKEPEKQTRFK